MARKRRSTRHRVGRVFFYVHRSSWWLYYRGNGRAVRRRVGPNGQDAARVAAQVNGQVAVGVPTVLSF